MTKLLKLCLVFLLGTATAAQAQKPRKLPKVGKTLTQASTQAAQAVNPIRQQALYHAAALRQIQAAKTAHGITPTVATVATPPAVKTPHYKHPRKTAQQWVAQLEEFVKKEKRYPTANSLIKEESALYAGIHYVQKITPPQAPLAKRIQALQTQYRFPRNTAQTWLSKLEAFIAKEGHFPLATHGLPEHKLYSNVSALLQRLDPQDPVAVRIRQLQAQYPAFVSTHTSQHWLEKLEQFVAQEKHYPHSSPGHPERPLYMGVQNSLQRLSPADPVARRLREIKRNTPGNPPQEIVARLEAFVARYERWPKTDGAEYHLYEDIKKMLDIVEPDDPLARRVRALAAQYGPQR